MHIYQIRMLQNMANENKIAELYFNIGKNTNRNGGFDQAPRL